MLLFYWIESERSLPLQMKRGDPKLVDPRERESGTLMEHSNSNMPSTEKTAIILSLLLTRNTPRGGRKMQQMTLMIRAASI